MLIVRHSSVRAGGAPRARNSSASAAPSARAPVDVDDGALALAAHHVATVARGDAGRAATAGPPPTRRTRRAASGSCRRARAKTRARRPSRASSPRSASGASAAIRSARSARHSIASAPWPGAGRLSSGSSSAADPRAEAEALQPRRRENDRVVLAFVELAQPRVDVAAQRLDRELRDSARAAAPRGAGSTCRRRRRPATPTAIRSGSTRTRRADPRARRSPRARSRPAGPSARPSANGRRGRRGLRAARSRAP